MSLYLELVGNDGLAASASIRRLGLPRAGFGLVFAYEITENKTTVRGTIEYDPPRTTEEPEVNEDLALLAAVLADYTEKTKKDT